MGVSYKKLFHLLIEKELTTAQLQQKADISANIISKFKKNEYVSLETLEKVCKVLDCEISEILDFCNSPADD